MLSTVTCGSELALTVQVGDSDCANVPVHARVALPQDVADLAPEDIAVEVRQKGGKAVVPGQIVVDGEKQPHVWWVLPSGKAGSVTRWTAKLARVAEARKDVFSWRDEAGQHLDLLLNGRPVTRYMYVYDPSTQQQRFKTAKPFHHVFDPAGQKLITSPGGQPYPHHRGIFIGWNKLMFDGKRYDLWHVRNVAQVHQRFLCQMAGPVLARSTALIHWNDDKGEPMVAEERETTVSRQAAPVMMLVRFRSRLTPVRGDVLLDGDPEHGGCQYRPHPQVAATNKLIAKKAKEAKQKGEKVAPHPDRTTYLFHKEGINPRKDLDLPWVGMSYVLDGQRYSVQHMNHPTNPKKTRYSAYRDYGRFGAFFKKEVKAGETLALCYGFCVMAGGMPGRDELAQRYAAFAGPPKVSAGK